MAASRCTAYATVTAPSWVLTQSLNAIAQRSPASIVRADPEIAQLKVKAYNAIETPRDPQCLDFHENKD
jgi:hypothetical protein